MRLAQLKIRDAPGPLLPSLKQFRVIEPNESSISQLSLFFTKSLRSLEATGVPEAQQSAFLSFLITLVDEAPLLSAITLGPGSFTTTCLNACLNFDHLSHIEFLDAASSIDFDFLVAIGGLPELETFILHARTATYIPPRVPSPIPQFPARPCEPIDIQSRSDNPNAAATVNRFSRLRRLDIIGSLPLIRHLYEHIIAVDLEKLGMTLVRTSSPTSHVLPEDEPPTINDIDLETDSFFTLVENAVEEKWPLTLKDVRLGHLQDYVSEFYGGWGYVSSDPDPIALPFMTFGMLLKHEILENLEIAGWTLPYNSEKQCLVDEILQAALPELKTMHLPIGAPTPGIQLDQLLPMVRAFPKLMSLQCGFEQPGTCPIPPNLAADVPLHGLKVLSVGHQNSDIDQKQQLRIASVLDILFPNLERIETHTGYHAEVWAYIYELIKMCQASRLNHANRLSVSCGP
jgi:hypothetical protein